jgi:hypothetical protein
MYNSGAKVTIDPAVAPLTLASAIFFTLAQEIAPK